MSDNLVIKRSDKLAKIFLIIPMILFVLGVTCFGVCLAIARLRVIVYTFLMIGSFSSFGLEILPGTVFTVIGMIRAADSKMTGFFILGIIEVIGAVLLVHLIWFIVFVAGPGV